MTRVAFDGKALRPPRGGVARYVEGLLAGLEGAAYEDLRVELLQPARPRRTLPWVMWDLRRTIAHGFDVAHFPFYYAPLAPRIPVTVAIHDVLFLEHPEWFPGGRSNPLSWLVRHGSRRAAAVVTFSHASRTAIIERCRVPADRVRVIPHGIDRMRFAPATAEECREICGRHRLEAPFLLVVGFVEARRGLDVAIEAVAELRAENPDLELVLVGPLRSRVAALEVAPAWVRCLGRVADEDLAALYGAAEIVLAPSRGEGFDLPLLEALACGAAVAASDIAVHLEHFAGAVELFASGDSQALAEAVRRVLGDTARRSALLAAGQRAAAGFTWEESAQAHADLWREVVG